MKRWFYVLVGLFGGAALASQPSSSDTLTGYIDHVQSGQHIVFISDNGERIVFRLSYILTPEAPVSAWAQDIPYASAARSVIESRCRVRQESTAKARVHIQGSDAHGKRQAVLFCDEVDIGALLLGSGLALLEDERRAPFHYKAMKSDAKQHRFGLHGLHVKKE